MPLPTSSQGQPTDTGVEFQPVFQNASICNNKHDIALQLTSVTHNSLGIKKQNSSALCNVKLSACLSFKNATIMQMERTDGLDR